MTELEVLVPFSALAAAVLVWRHFAKRFADRHAFLRHLAGASTGFAAFIATLAFWFEVTTDPAQSNTTTPALSKEQQRTARPYEKAKNKTLRDIDRMSRSAAREIGVGFAALNNVPPEDHEAFYRCLGDRVRTKSPDLSLHEVMGWCLDEYTHDRDAATRSRASLLS